MSRNRIRAFAVLGVTLAACRGPEQEEPQVLRMDIWSEPPTLDPTQAADAASISVVHAITRPLVYFDENLNVVPSLAEDWDISEDATEITFHLRAANYSDGEPIVAGDLVYSWKRLLDPRIAAPYSYAMSDVAGAEPLLEYAYAETPPTDEEIDAALDQVGVSAPDDGTFVVTLARPATYFLSVAALWVAAPIREDWITSPDATEAENYVASGPFMLATWDHNQEIVLVPNPEWYGEGPTLTEVRISMTAEPADAQAAYEAGELDVVITPGEDIERVTADPVLGEEVHEVAQLTLAYFTFNNAQGPLANEALRTALAQSVDKATLLDETWDGMGLLAGSIVPPGMPGHQPDLGLPYDVEDAQAKLAQALTELGYANVSELPVLTLGYNTDAGHEPRVQFIADAWSEDLGVETELLGYEFGEFLERRAAGEFDVSRNGWGADFPHPHNFLGYLFHSQSPNNDSGPYDNPAFDALIEQAAAEPDAAQQEVLYNQAQQILVDDAVTLPLRWGSTTYEVKPYANLVPTPQDWIYGDTLLEKASISAH